MDDVLTREGLVRQKILHEPGLDVQLLYRLPGIHIPRGSYGHNVCAFGKHLQGNQNQVGAPCEGAAY